MKGKFIAIVLGVLAIGAAAAGGGYTYLMGESGGKRVLFIDSYHAGYPWSDGITAGIQQVLADKDVELRIHRMDTKRNGSEEFKKQAAMKWCSMPATCPAACTSTAWRWARSPNHGGWSC